MWKDLFRSQRTLARLEDGPWGPYLDEFSAALAQGSYSVETMRRSLSAADHFGRWLLAQDFTLADADERKVEQYRGILGRCASGARRTAPSHKRPKSGHAIPDGQRRRSRVYCRRSRVAC
jgi:hypothetical protein